METDKNQIVNKEEEETSEINHQSDSIEGYVSNYIIDKKAISRQTFDLKDKENFATKFSLKEIFSRENILYFRILNGEQVIDSKDTKGNVELSIVNENHIYKEIKRLKNGKKIQDIHISTIQFILKSTYMLGIDSKIDLEILDRRFKDPKKHSC